MSSHRQRSFVKLLIEDDFTKSIRIPPAFMARHEDEFTQKWILETPTISKKLSVEVNEYGRHHYLCGPGWREFAKSLNLSAGDFLLFRCADKSSDRRRHSAFEVELYGGSGLAKSPQSPAGLEEGSVSRESSDKPVERRLSKSKYKSHRRESKRTKTNVSGVKEEAASEEYEEEVKIKSKEVAAEFRVTLSKFHWRRLNIAADFVRKARLNEKEKVFVINPISGKKWDVEICQTDRRVAFGKGWSCFRNQNNLRIGGKYKFTLVQDDDGNTLLFHHI